MTIHYHGTPISPRSELLRLAGRHFCVSHADRRDIAVCHQTGQSVMLDNGAFSAWTKGRPTNWPAYYAWAEEWLDCPTTWAVIPDVIDGTEDEQDELVEQWPFGFKGAPVWHMNESIERLIRLVDQWPLVCMGSTGTYRVVGSEAWERRMVRAWNCLANRRGPKVHMLRGMAQAKGIFPFYSLDSTDVARNYKSAGQDICKMVDYWDALQCPLRWDAHAEQMEMIA